MSLQGPAAGNDAEATRAVGFEPSTGAAPPAAAETTSEDPAVSDPAVSALFFDESTGGGNLFGTSGQKTSEQEIRFSHFLNERLEGSSMIADIVPAKPALLATSFFNADSGEIRRDGRLQAKVAALLGGIPEYDKEIKAGNLAVALVDLSEDKLQPKYGGVNDRENFYAASVAKVCGLLAAYQLKADANAFLRGTGISDILVLENELKRLWSAQGIPAQSQPRVSKVLQLNGNAVELRKEMIDRFDALSYPNENGSTAIVLSRFPFVGSTMLAYGLFSPANNKTGLWVNLDYGPIKYDGEEIPSGRWVSPENLYPFPGVPWHSVNAVSIAQFFTLAAQGRMIDGKTSQAILKHLDLYIGGCAPEVNWLSLKNRIEEEKGRVAAKCGFLPLERPWDYLHVPLYYKNETTSQEFVVVILTQNRTYGLVKPLFKALVQGVLEVR